jgi:four helix bundle protein
MSLVTDFEDLEVYQLAVALQQEIYERTKRFPADEKYSLTDQVRRSSRSIGANIAEAWGKRRYKAHFVSKLSDSDGEQLETRHWLKTAFQCGYLADQECRTLVAKCQEIGRKLGRMMTDADRWCARF